MGLSLLPQTVLALDPDQRQAERREGYDVATVHYTDAKGDEQAIPFTETGKPWWDGIGNATSSTAVFKGTLDGCGHTIDQMLAGSGCSGAGLFLNTDGAAIQNLTVIGSTAASCCAAPTMAGSMPNSPGTPAASWAC